MSLDICCSTWRSPLGWIGLAASPCALVCVSVPRSSSREALREVRRIGRYRGRTVENKLIRATIRLLQRYFRSDPRVDFSTLSLDMDRATPLQREIWALLRAIPAGDTRIYGELAAMVGRPNAARAIGQCVARNRWAIVVPCHRVVGADGRLTGYGGGLDVKRCLLEWENRCMTAHDAKVLAAAPQRRHLDAHRN